MYSVGNNPNSYNNSSAYNNADNSAILNQSNTTTNIFFKYLMTLAEPGGSSKLITSSSKPAIDTFNYADFSAMPGPLGETMSYVPTGGWLTDAGSASIDETLKISNIQKIRDLNAQFVRALRSGDAQFVKSVLKEGLKGKGNLSEAQLEQKAVDLYNQISRNSNLFVAELERQDKMLAQIQTDTKNMTTSRDSRSQELKTILTKASNLGGGQS